MELATLNKISFGKLRKEGNGYGTQLQNILQKKFDEKKKKKKKFDVLVLKEIDVLILS